jgi:hypothetical protein
MALQAKIEALDTQLKSSIDVSQKSQKEKDELAKVHKALEGKYQLIRERYKTLATEVKGSLGSVDTIHNVAAALSKAKAEGTHRDLSMYANTRQLMREYAELSKTLTSLQSTIEHGDVSAMKTAEKQLYLRTIMFLRREITESQMENTKNIAENRYLLGVNADLETRISRLEREKTARESRRAEVVYSRWVEDRQRQLEHAVKEMKTTQLILTRLEPCVKSVLQAEVCLWLWW